MLMLVITLWANIIVKGTYKKKKTYRFFYVFIDPLGANVTCNVSRKALLSEANGCSILSIT